jgi:hypothetical protein
VFRFLLRLAEDGEAERPARVRDRGADWKVGGEVLLFRERGFNECGPLEPIRG